MKQEGSDEDGEQGKCKWLSYCSSIFPSIPSQVGKKGDLWVELFLGHNSMLSSPIRKLVTINSVFIILQDYWWKPLEY